jgi:transcriptional regulator with XRE-family HTH domain
VPVNFTELGKRLRAYRIGANLSPEQVAEKLGISRGALYKYEKGEVIKFETIERLSQLLNIPLTSLLGVGVEYFTNAVSYFERIRQLEAESDQIIAYLKSLSFLAGSSGYPNHLRRMLIEGLPADIKDRASSLTQIDRLVSLIEERQGRRERRVQNILNIVGATQLEQTLRSGLIGTHRLSPAERRKRKELAREQISYMIALMDNEPIGVQIGIVEDTLPDQSFHVLRQRDTTFVAVSPFRFGELPNIRLGVATVTAAADAAALYTRVAEDLWHRAHKGSRGADFLREMLKEVKRSNRSDE